MEGTYLALQTYLPKYKSGEEGLIVNMASICGFHSFQISPIYCTAKHGLIGLGKALGGEEFYKKYKVRVVTMCPGMVRTPLSEKTRRTFLSRLTTKRDWYFGYYNTGVSNLDSSTKAVLEYDLL